MKGGSLGDSGDLGWFSLGGEPLPGPDPGTGYLEKLSSSSGSVPLRSVNKLMRGLVVLMGEREPGDFLWTAFDRVGLL